MSRHLGVLLIAGVVAWPCGAQSKPEAEPAPCSVAPQPDPCGTTPGAVSKPGGAQKFPFPGEVGTPSSQGSRTPSLTGAPDAPTGSDASGAPAAKKFPFPGDTSGPGSGAASGASSSSSDSSSSSSSDDTPQVDPGAGPVSPGAKEKGGDAPTATPGRHILHRVNPIGTKLESADERESEDIDVAHFYIGNGDLKGAYTRAQDAVKTAPDDPGAHFLLADVALKLNKRDEALAEYSACLKLDPIPKEARDARKALARLKQ